MTAPALILILLSGPFFMSGRGNDLSRPGENNRALLYELVIETTETYTSAKAGARCLPLISFKRGAREGGFFFDA